MFDILFRARRWPIGLDIGSDSIKMLQLVKSGPSVSVSAFGRWKFPDAAADPKQRGEMTVEAVRQMLRSGNFRGQKVVSCLPCSQLSVKNIRLPRMAEHELAEAIRWEATERFGFEVTPDTLNWLNAGTVRQGNDEQQEIIMMASPRQTIEDQLALLAKTGLRVETVDAEPVALFRVFERYLRRKADEDFVSVIADIGSAATRVVVARGRQIVFIKSIDIGGRKLTEAVAKQLNLPYQDAFDLRSLIMKDNVEPQQSPPAEDQPEKDKNVSWTIRDALRGEAEALAREIALCLRYCSVTFRGLRPERVMVTGGQAYDPSLLELLKEHLGIECVIGQPLRGIDVSAACFGGNRRGMLAEWAVCAGLAIRNMEFQRLEEDSENGQHRLSA